MVDGTTGLLVPATRSATGYRLYSAENLLRLQQIMIGRELGLNLSAIRQMLDEPCFDVQQALLEQREQLELRMHDHASMLLAINEALAVLETGDFEDSHMHKLFTGFDPSKYETEAHQRWGDSPAFAEASRRTRQYTDEQRRAIVEEFERTPSHRIGDRRHGDDPRGAQPP